MANEFLGGVEAGTRQLTADRVADLSYRTADRLDDQNTRANNTDARQQAQFELNRKIAGYDAQGNPNQDRQTADQIKSNQLELKLQQQEASMALMLSQNNTRDMTEATKSLSMGNVKDAVTTMKQNPNLRKQLLEQFGAQNIAPVDWVNDKDLFKGTDMYFDLDEKYLADPKIRTALDSSFFKIIGPDGVARLGNTQNLVKQTGTLDYMTEADQKGMVDRFNLIGEILSGSVLKTPEQQAIDDTKEEVAGAMTELNSEVIMGIMDGAGTAEEKLAKISAMTQKKMSAKETAQTVKAQTEAEIALATKEAKISKATSDADKAKQDFKDAQPIVGESDFLKNITDNTKVPYNDASLNTAKKIQGTNKLTDGRNKEVEGLMSKAKEFHTLTEEMGKIEWDKDALTKVGIAMGKLMDPSLSLKEKQVYANTLRVNTKLRALTAAYVKYMSGAAVTEGEFQRYNDIVSAGDWSNKESAMISMKAFTDYLRGASKISLDGITDRPYDYLIKRQKYNKWADENPQFDFDVGAGSNVSLDEFKKNEG